VLHEDSEDGDWTRMRLERASKGQAEEVMGHGK